MDSLTAFSLSRNFKSARSSKVSDRLLTCPVVPCGGTYFVAPCEKFD